MLTLVKKEDSQNDIRRNEAEIRMSRMRNSEDSEQMVNDMYPWLKNPVPAFMAILLIDLADIVNPPIDIEKIIEIVASKSEKEIEVSYDVDNFLNGEKSGSFIIDNKIIIGISKAIKYYPKSNRFWKAFQLYSVHCCVNKLNFYNENDMNLLKNDSYTFASELVVPSSWILEDLGNIPKKITNLEKLNFVKIMMDKYNVSHHIMAKKLNLLYTHSVIEQEFDNNFLSRIAMKRYL